MSPCKFYYALVYWLFPTILNGACNRSLLTHTKTLPKTDNRKKSTRGQPKSPLPELITDSRNTLRFPPSPFAPQCRILQTTSMNHPLSAAWPSPRSYATSVGFTGLPQPHSPPITSLSWPFAAAVWRKNRIFLCRGDSRCYDV